MNRLKKLFGIGLAASSLALTSCGLLDTPEYPDSDFSIVGTWEYHIPALTGSAPEKGEIYNADGWITFTEDMRFSYTINSDRGEVKGYGTYVYDPDSGVDLTYELWDEIEDYASSKNAVLSWRSYGYMIHWGQEGDRVESDYMRLTNDVGEFFRVSQLAYEDTITAYSVPVGKDSCHYWLVDFSGDGFLEMKISLEDILKGINEEKEKLQ